MTILFTELNCIIFTALDRTFSTSRGIEFTVNDRKIFYGLIPLSCTLCNRINYGFLKSVYSKWHLRNGSFLFDRNKTRKVL